MYIPIFKNRSNEMRFIKNYNQYLSEKIVPLFEIIADKYVKKSSSNKKSLLKLPTSDNEIITLESISQILNENKAFIDYFRFDKSEYPKAKIDPNKCELTFKLSRDLNDYVNHIRSICDYKNFIPVISIKNKCILDLVTLEALINEIQSKTDTIAIRITYELFDKYVKLISNLLRKSDYLLFDIREHNVSSMRIEFNKLNKYPIIAKKILLNSPRPHGIKNNQFELHDITPLIDNSALAEFKNYDFIGFGDFAGLRDILPDGGGGNGKGAAYSLLFQYSNNSFYSYVNPDTNLGARGYRTLIPQILSDKNILNPYDNCPSYVEIKKLPSVGSFSSWIYITLVRYVSQISLYYK